MAGAACMDQHMAQFWEGLHIQKWYTMCPDDQGKKWEPDAGVSGWVYSSWAPPIVLDDPWVFLLCINHSE